MKDTQVNSYDGCILISLVEDIQQIGLKDGDLVIVHGSFKALGLKDAAPVDVIHTLLSILGANGTLMMPTFTYSYSGIWNVKPFNPDKTSGISNGVLSETLRKHPEAMRSGHPTYSVVAVGRHAKEITQNKKDASPLGHGSSYEVAINLGAKILLMGVGNNRNSMIHYAEVVADVPYNDIPFREFFGRTALVEINGEVAEIPLADEFPACSANFGIVDEYLEKMGILKHGKLCDVDSMLMDGREAVGAVVERLRKEPEWLLCESMACEPCTLRKKRLKEKGLL